MNTKVYKISIHAFALALVFSVQAVVPAQSPGQSAEVRLPFIEVSEFPQLCHKIKQQAKGSLLIVRFYYGGLHGFGELVALNNKYKNKGLKIVAFSIDSHSDKRSVISEVTKFKVDFDVFLLDDSDDDNRNKVIQQEWVGEEFGLSRNSRGAHNILWAPIDCFA